MIGRTSSTTGETCSVKAKAPCPELVRAGSFWRVRYPTPGGEGFHLLFRHRAQGEHALSLSRSQASESRHYVGIEAGRLVRARHLVDVGDARRLFFVIRGEEVDASDSLEDRVGLIFMDPDRQFYTPGYPRCLDCGGMLLAKGGHGKWIEVLDLERNAAHFGARFVDFADGLRQCAACGSRFTDTRYGWVWPLKAYASRIRPSTLDALSQVAVGSGLFGVVGLISVAEWWVIPVGAVWFVSCMAAASWLVDLVRERDIPQDVLDAARRAADPRLGGTRDRGPRPPVRF